MRVAFGVAVLAFLAESAGYSGLAQLVGGGMLVSAYIAVILYGAIRVLDGLVAFAVRVRPLRLLGMVQRHRYTLRRLVAKYPRSLSAARAMETLEARGWLEDLDVAPEEETDRFQIEGPGAEQVQPLQDEVILDEPETE